MPLGAESAADPWMWRIMSRAMLLRPCDLLIRVFYFLLSDADGAQWRAANNPALRSLDAARRTLDGPPNGEALKAIDRYRIFGAIVANLLKKLRHKGVL
jgi:hypothetical protein